MPDAIVPYLPLNERLVIQINGIDCYPCGTLECPYNLPDLGFLAGTHYFLLLARDVVIIFTLRILLYRLSMSDFN
jgi:hypothetical protein